MELILDYRIDNIVSCEEMHSYNSFQRISTIEVNNYNEKVFCLEDIRNTGSEFCCFEGQLKPIYLDKNHLTKLGFHFDEETKVYSNGNILIKHFSTIKGNDPMNMAYIDHGLRVIPFTFPQLATEDQVINETILMLYLHTFQNYCEDHGIKEIDFGLIK